MWWRRIGDTFLTLTVLCTIGYFFTLKYPGIFLDYVVFATLGIVFLVLSLVFIQIGVNQKSLAPEVLAQREKDRLPGSQNYQTKTKKLRKAGLYMLIIPTILLFFFLLAYSGVWVDSNPLVVIAVGMIGEAAPGIGAAIALMLVMMTLGVLCGISVILGLAFFVIAVIRHSKSQKV